MPRYSSCLPSEVCADIHEAIIILHLSLIKVNYYERFNKRHFAMFQRLFYFKVGLTSAPKNSVLEWSDLFGWVIIVVDLLYIKRAVLERLSCHNVQRCIILITLASENLMDVTLQFLISERGNRSSDRLTKETTIVWIVRLCEVHSIWPFWCLISFNSNFLLTLYKSFSLISFSSHSSAKIELFSAINLSISSTLMSESARSTTSRKVRETFFFRETRVLKKMIRRHAHMSPLFSNYLCGVEYLLAFF